MMDLFIKIICSMCDNFNLIMLTERQSIDVWLCTCHDIKERKMRITTKLELKLTMAMFSLAARQTMSCVNKILSCLLVCSSYLRTNITYYRIYKR